MAKLQFTPPTYATNNVEQLPAVVIGDETAIQTVFDKVGVDGKAYTIELLSELNGNEGANKIGLLNPNLASLSVADAVEEVRLVAVQAQAGTIVANSIDNSKLVADIKVGSLGTLTTTEKLSVTGAINEIDADLSTLSSTVNGVSSVASTNTVNLSMLREAKSTTGSAVAYVLDTTGTFDLTVDGNRLMFRPNVANTGSATLAVDGQTAVELRKINDSGSPVALEARDLKQGVPVEFVRSVADNFFILRPSGGSNIKSIQYGSVSNIWSNTLTTVNVTISAIDPLKSIIISNFHTSASAINSATFAEILNSTTIRFTRGNGVNNVANLEWTVIEFNNVKNKQSGVYVQSGNLVFENITVSSYNIGKTILIATTRTGQNSTVQEMYSSLIKPVSSTQIAIRSASSGETSWQLLEFN